MTKRLIDKDITVVTKAAGDRCSADEFNELVDLARAVKQALVDGQWDINTRSIYAAPSSLNLGDNFKISSGVNALCLQFGDGSNAIGVSVPYDAQGSKDPFAYKFKDRVSLNVNTKSDIIVNPSAAPYSIQYQTFGDNLTHDFYFVPNTAGEMRVRFWLGVNNSGDLIFDEIRVVTPAEAQAKLPIPFGVGNKYILPQGTNLYASFEGIELLGGVVDAGPFAGQLLPYFVSDVHAYVKVRLATFGFADYNNTLTQPDLASDTWTRLKNNAAGAVTNTNYLPIGVTSLIDSDPVSADNGRIDFSELSLGDQVTIRHTLSLTPNSNGQTFQIRHLVGQAGQTYALPTGVPIKMEQGGGVSTGDFTVESTIYIGDENTRLTVQKAGIYRIDFSGLGFCKAVTTSDTDGSVIFNKVTGTGDSEVKTRFHQIRWYTNSVESYKNIAASIVISINANEVLCFDVKGVSVYGSDGDYSALSIEYLRPQ